MNKLRLLFLFYIYFIIHPLKAQINCPITENLAGNGSFETPIVVGSYDILIASPWINLVESGEIEIQNTNAPPAIVGNQKLEVNGTVRGQIYQDIMVLPNKIIEWQFCYRKRGNANENVLITISDELGGNLSTANTTGTISSWTLQQGTYTTTATQTILRFKMTGQGGASGSGNYVDNVIINYPECAIFNPSVPTTLNLCQGETGALTVANTKSNDTFLWSTGATTSSINVSTSGIYSVVINRPNGCGPLLQTTLQSNVIVNPFPVTSAISN